MLKYKKTTRNGFTWTSDTKLGRNGFTRHRLYIEGDRETCLAVIERTNGLYYLKIGGSSRSRFFGELQKAKATAENYVRDHFHALGYNLVKVRRHKI